MERRRGGVQAAAEPTPNLGWRLTLSVLDLAPILQGGTPADASGTRCSWRSTGAAELPAVLLAEHHNMRGSAARPPRVIGTWGGHSRIRIGAGASCCRPRAAEGAEQFAR